VTVLLVAIGAAVGAPLRYLTDRAVRARHDHGFPWGTLTVNVAGSFILGVLTAAAAALGPGVTALVGTGFCGALTTYSTFSYETLRLLEDRTPAKAVTNVVGSVLLGVAAAAAGWFIGHSVI
jgi:CrcB protein